MAAMAPRVLLIGGRSHAGKSTVAARLAERLGWALQSTDKLGRHPGRPWGTVADRVVAHYTTLDDAAILDAVVAHQHRMWPAIEQVVRDQLAAGQGLVLEGSGIMPADVSANPIEGVAAVWLTAEHGFVRERIERESGYAGAEGNGRFLIDRFVERNRRLDAIYREGAGRFGFPLIDVGGKTVEAVANEVLAAVSL